MNASHLPANLSAADFNFTNCSLAASWASNVQRSADVPLFQTTSLLYSGLRGYLSLHPNVSTSENDTGLFHWMINSIYNDDPDDMEGIFVYENMANFTEVACRDELCMSLSYDGFADLSGRGMLLNFFIEAGLITIYLLVLLAAAKLEYLPAFVSTNRHVKRCMVAFQESTRTFLDAALVFSIALLIATIQSFVTVMMHPKTPFTTWATVTSVFLSLFAVIPAFLLHIAGSDALRRVKWRRFVWGFILSLIITMVALYYNLPTPSKLYEEYVEDDDPSTTPNRNLDNMNWEQNCVDRGREKAFGKSLLALSITVVVIFAIYAIFILNVFRLPWLKPARNASARTFRGKIMYAIGTVCFAGMWAALIIFIYFRHQIGKLAGSSNQDHEWSFGQILALATWIPVVVDLLCIMALGPEHGLTGQMSRRYKVVESDAESRENLLLQHNGYGRTNGEDEAEKNDVLPLTHQRHIV